MNKAVIIIQHMLKLPYWRVDTTPLVGNIVDLVLAIATDLLTLTGGAAREEVPRKLPRQEMVLAVFGSLLACFSLGMFLGSLNGILLIQ